jgi:hypothetical protein
VLARADIALKRRLPLAETDPEVSLMTNPTFRRCGGGASLLTLFVLLAVFVVAGAANYRRNLLVEQQEHAARPFASYETEDLLMLSAAYRAEVEALTRRHQGVRTQRVETRERGFFGDQIDEYERVRRHSGSRRALGAELSEAEVALGDVEQELALRRSESETRIGIHLRRLLTP